MPVRRSKHDGPRRDHYSQTPLTMKTLENIANQQGLKISRVHAGPPGFVSTSFYHDLTSPSYTWMLPGWIAEERVVPSGRVYKVFILPLLFYLHSNTYQPM